jgi:hypothetical protein
MVPAMQERPQSLPGLIVHTVRVRWSQLSKSSRIALGVGLVLIGVSSMVAAKSFLYSCPTQSSCCAHGAR